MKPTLVRLNRRDVLRLASSGVGYAALARLAEGTAYASGPIGPTTIENLQPGAVDWALVKAARNGEIEGYANLTSVNRGGSIKFYVNCQDPSYTLNVYRMGWYAGLGGRLMLGPVEIAGIQQPAATLDPNTNLIECRWNSPYSLTVPYDASDPTVWASGYYLAKLTSKPNGWQSYIPFVVRDDGRTSDFLMQSSVTTFQAYNTYGGKCLYDYLSPGGRSRKVSFNRPYQVQPNVKLIGGCGAAEFLTGGDGGPPAGWEYNMVRFLEREGFDVSYCTNIDTHSNPNLLLRHKGFLSVGHDEYWSWEMRQNVTQARDAGVSLGFFSANSVYWQIRLETSPFTGEANRTIVCYKFSPRDYQGDATEDPFYLDNDPSNDHLITISWRSTLNGSTRQPMPEEQLLGTQYEFGADRVNAAMVCTNPNHWVFAGTGLPSGGTIPGVIGYEADRTHGSQPANTVVLARSPHSGNVYTGNSYSDMTLYQAGSGALVFATGSMQWAYGLDDFNAPNLRSPLANPAAQQMTRNVLSAMTQVERTGVTGAQAKPGGPYVTLLGEATQFDGSASHGANASITRYTWDFGDGASAEGEKPSHTYAEPGSYIVKLTVVDSKGNTDDSVGSVSVNRLLWKVQADSNWDTTYQGKRYYYPASGLIDDIIPVPTTADLFKQWLSTGNLEMDATGNLTTPQNIYGQLLRRTKLSNIRVFQSGYNQGSQFRTRGYRVYTRLTGGSWQMLKTNTLPNVNRCAQDNVFTARDVDEIRIEIVSTWDLVNKAVGLSEIKVGGSTYPLDSLPVPVYNAPISGKEGIPIDFDASASYDPDGTVVSWRWDFGDGTFANVAKVSHTYETDGKRNAILTVGDDAGNFASVNVPVDVAPNRRYKSVTASSTFDVTSGGVRYYYPPGGVGDYIVPSSSANLFKQWFSASHLSTDASGNLVTPVSLTMNFFARQTVNRVRVTQTWYTKERAFQTRGFQVYLRQTGGDWQLVGSGVLQPVFGSTVDVTFPAQQADSALIKILSTWDNTSSKAVGLAEVEMFSGNETGNKLPTAVAVVPAIAPVNAPFQLDGSQSTDPDGTVTAYDWAFSDGTALTGVKPTKTIPTPSTIAGVLTVTDNGGAKASTSFEVTARYRFKNVTASSVFDRTSGGKRYYYPPYAVGDFVVPAPTAADLFMQWLSDANLPQTNGVFSTPVTLDMQLWDQATISKATLYQSSYTDGKGFQSKDVKVYARLGSGSWIQVASGQLPKVAAAALTLTFAPVQASDVRIEVLSTWDIANKAVGLSEVEIS